MFLANLRDVSSGRVKPPTTKEMLKLHPEFYANTDGSDDLLWSNSLVNPDNENEDEYF